MSQKIIDKSNWNDNV